MALHSGMHSSEELVDAHNHVWHHIFNFINSMCLKCTVQLGIPDIIYKHGKPMMLSELTDALAVKGTKSSCMEHLMRHMVHSKFFVKTKIFKEDDQEGYWLTSSSLLLLKDEPLSVAPFMLAMLDPILTDPWHHLSEWFGTDHATPFLTTHGMNFWELAGHDSRLNAVFNEGMASDARLVSSVISRDCRHVFEGLESMVDVGGGTGTVAKAIVDSFPGLKCTVLDLPHVVAGLEASKNLTYVGGDMFESIPPTDAVFMKWILHDWADEDCVRILENCKKAIFGKEEGGGKVIIVDMVVEEDKVGEESLETQLHFDMMMMTLTTGKERTEKEWAKLFNLAGFKDYKITHAFGLRSIIEVFP